MRRRNHLKVDTFPFLAVLLCAMGSLILVLLIMDRRSKLAARNRGIAEARKIAEEYREAEARRRLAHEKKRQEQQLEWDQKKQKLAESVTAEDVRLDGQLREIQEKLARAASRLRDEEKEIEQLNGELAREKLRARQEEKSLDAAQTEAQKIARKLSGAEEARKQLTLQLETLEKLLQELKDAKKQDGQTFSVVPYRGKNGDNRWPLYMECTADGFIFHPDRLKWSPDSPVTLLREEVQRRIQQQAREMKLAGVKKQRPYLLLLVRPAGVKHYYELQASLRDIDLDFGYEFVDPDWKLEIPDSTRILAGLIGDRRADGEPITRGIPRSTQPGGMGPNNGSLAQGSGVPGTGSGTGTGTGSGTGTGVAGGMGLGTGSGTGGVLGSGPGSGIGPGTGSGTGGVLGSVPGTGIGSGTGTGVAGGTGPGTGSGTGGGVGSGTGNGLGSAPGGTGEGPGLPAVPGVSPGVGNNLAGGSIPGTGSNASGTSGGNGPGGSGPQLGASGEKNGTLAGGTPGQSSGTGPMLGGDGPPGIGSGGMTGTGGTGQGGIGGNPGLAGQRPQLAGSPGTGTATNQQGGPGSGTGSEGGSSGTMAPGSGSPSAPGGSLSSPIAALNRPLPFGSASVDTPGSGDGTGKNPSGAAGTGTGTGTNTGTDTGAPGTSPGTARSGERPASVDGNFAPLMPANSAPPGGAPGSPAGISGAVQGSANGGGPTQADAGGSESPRRIVTGSPNPDTPSIQAPPLLPSIVPPPASEPGVAPHEAARIKGMLGKGGSKNEEAQPGERPNTLGNPGVPAGDDKKNPEEEEAPRRPRMLRPARIHNQGEVTIFIECRRDQVVVYPGEKVLEADTIRQAPPQNPLYVAVYQEIMRRQAVVPRGEKGPRYVIRFLLHRDGEATFHRAYPALESLPVTKSRYNLMPDDDVQRIVLSD